MYKPKISNWNNFVVNLADIKKYLLETNSTSELKTSFEIINTISAIPAKAFLELNISTFVESHQIIHIIITKK